MMKSERVEVKENRSYISILKGLLITFILSFILLLILSILLTYTNISENVISPCIIAITSISILIGSLMTSTKIRKKGLLNGGIIGGTYILLLYLISSCVLQQFSLNEQSIIMIVLGIIFGILGGVIGVNLKK